MSQMEEEVTDIKEGKEIKFKPWKVKRQYLMVDDEGISLITETAITKGEMTGIGIVRPAANHVSQMITACCRALEIPNIFGCRAI